MSEIQQAQKKQTKKQVKLPSKKTLNLLIKEKTLASPSRLIPILLLIVVGAYLFSKYAVAARLEKVSREEAELAEMQSQLEMITNAFSDYDEVEEQYNRYSYENFDKTIPDRLDVLEMLEKRLFPICSIQSLTVNGRDLNMVITDIDLQTLTYINGMLLIEEPLIESISIGSYTDNTDSSGTGAKTVTATVNMTLADASSTYTPGQLEFDPDQIIADGQAAAETEAGAPETTPEARPADTVPEAQPDGTEGAPEDVNLNGGAE